MEQKIFNIKEKLQSLQDEANAIVDAICTAIEQELSKHPKTAVMSFNSINKWDAESKLLHAQLAIIVYNIKPVMVHEHSNTSICGNTRKEKTIVSHRDPIISVDYLQRIIDTGKIKKGHNFSVDALPETISLIKRLLHHDSTGAEDI